MTGALLTSFLVLMVTGIGSCTVIFAVADALLLRPLPVRNPKEFDRTLRTYPNIRPQSYFRYPVYEENQPSVLHAIGCHRTA